MPLPSRPLGADAPQPEKKEQVNAPVEELSLPDYEVLSLPDLDDSRNDSSAEEFEFPALDFEPQEFNASDNPNQVEIDDQLALPDFEPSSNTPIAPEEIVEDDDFDSLFEDSAAIAPVAKEPEWDDELPDAPEESWDQLLAVDDEPLADLPPIPSPPAPKIVDDELSDLFEDDWDKEFTEAPVISEQQPSSAEMDDDDFDSFFNEPIEKNPTEELVEEKQNWGDEFEDYLKEIDADEDAPTEEYVSTFDAEEEGPASEEEGFKPLKKDSKKKPAKRKKKSGFSNLADGIFRSLGSIPIIGFIFRPLAKIASFALALLALLPLLAIPVIVYFIAAAQVPGATIATGPDGGAVSFDNFSFSNGEARGVALNEGDVIANVTPELTVWTYNPFGGGSLFAFDKGETCTGDEISLDMDAEETISLACESGSSDLFTKVSGKLSF